MVDRYWWPLERREDLEQCFAKASDALFGREVALDGELALEADRLIVSALKSGLPKILAKDTLPNLCHLFVGWGDAKYENRRLTSLIADYVHRGPDDREFIYQAHGEGDFHPWQTFAYLAMGGVKPDHKLTASSTLKELARNSTVIHTQAKEDLGHLLFSYTSLGLEDSITFRFIDPKGKDPLEADIYGVIVSAVKAHHFGSFVVCRKFHLTEGLCAMADQVSGLGQLRTIAQGFFSGQMDLLILVHRILSLAERFDELSPEEVVELDLLRDVLRVGRLFENHLYEVGHLTELACFGLRFGFEMNANQRAAAAGCLNLSNRFIGRFANGLAHAEMLLPFSHYRRGLTLWESAAKGELAPLDAFTADFDAAEALPAGSAPNVSPAFNFAPESEVPRERFQAVIDAYARACPDFPEAKGGIKHFRRISPPGWHRQLHYEFLDYGDKIGAEIHFENSELTGLLPSIRNHVEKLVDELGAESRYEFHFKNGGAAKLAIVFRDDAAEPELMVQAMCGLIRSTQPALEAANPDR